MKKSLPGLPCVYSILAFLAFMFSVNAGDLPNQLANAGFEDSASGKGTSWKKVLLSGWDVWLNSGIINCDAERFSPGYQSQNCIRLLSKNPKNCFVSIRHQKIIPVKPGQNIEASAFLKGKGMGHIRVYYYGEDGKKLSTYKMLGLQAGKNWNKIRTTFQVPAKVHGLEYSLEIIRGENDLCFDQAMLTIQ